MADTANIAQTISEGEETNLEAGEIAVELGNDADSKSDGDIAYGRDEMVDSEAESAPGEAHSSQLANLTYRPCYVTKRWDGGMG